MTAKQRANIKAYNAQMARLRRQERRMLERGYVFEDEGGSYIGFVPQERPERITKASVRKLEKIKGESYYSKARYINPITGDIVSAKEGRTIEHRLAGDKAAATRKARETGYVLPSPVSPAPITTEWAPTVTEIIDLIKKQSQLVEYGGWIRDEKKGSHRGGSYRKTVEKAISETEAWWLGKENNEELRVIVGRELERYFDSKFAYESAEAAIKADPVAAFKSVAEDFDEFMEALRKAQNMAARLVM